MEPLRRIEEGRPNSDDDGNNNMVAPVSEEEGSNIASLLVVVLSLFFVAIFGYALIGGVVSGDPTKGFSVTLIVASALAVVVAIGVLARYLYVKQKPNNNNLKIKGTFSTNDEENQEDPQDYEENEFPHEIKAIQPKSVVGEMSALSPCSYGGDSLTTFRHQIIRQQQLNERRGFDFSTITPADDGENKRRREDPPEDPPEVGAATYESALVTSESSDPSGEVIGEKKNDDNEKSLIRPKSPAHSVAKSLPPSILKKNLKHAPKRPSSTRSAPVPKRPASTRSVPANMITPATPGSVASSFFGKFGKNKKSSSETGASDPVEENKEKPKLSVKKLEAGGKPPMVRPPMLPPSNKKLEDKMTIMGSMPSTPADKSTFTIPPPRPIPRTPMGSEVFSEFQSVVGSTAASSTFDPVAHRRALEKMQEGAAPLGASPALPAYYDDDNEDEDDKESSVAAISLSYDVFAPPGPLGIVVDTTEKGCIVYSLKKSSPMQGLMNKGDLIIGLDNFDVRNMDASSLTKLMAKKSEQTERKFTLMPNNME